MQPTNDAQPGCRICAAIPSLNEMNNATCLGTVYISFLYSSYIWMQVQESVILFRESIHVGHNELKSGRMRSGVKEYVLENVLDS